MSLRKKLNDKGLSTIPIQTQERAKKTVRIIFHNETKLKQ